MMKVFLVEDEVVIRNAIKNSIDWEKEGYEFAGEASDGELAYPLILKSRPDILITDVKMPFMDGLELSEAIKKEMPDIKIIILSGYDDFSYAKRAIGIGITDYLLKPISAEKLLEAIDKVADKILRKRQEQELMRKYMEEMQENTEVEHQKFFTRLLTESLSITEALKQGRSMGMELSAECYNVVLFKLLDGRENCYGDERMNAWAQVEEYTHRRKNCYCFHRGVEGIALLCLADGEQELQEEIQELKEGLSRLMSRYPRVKYFGGIGRPVLRLRNLKDAFHQAEWAFAGRFTLPPNQIVRSEEVTATAKHEEELQVQGVGMVEKVREMISRFLRNGTEVESQSFVQACLEQLPEDNLRSMMMRQYILMDIYIMVLSFGEELGIDTEEIQKECGDMKTVMEHVADAEKMRSYIGHLIRSILKLRDQFSGRRYSDIIVAAQTYIAQNYMSENISLNAVAASVNMSSSYFSSIFSQEVGKTFVEYLTNIRMEKAKELLMCSSKKTSEIGYEVGYKDSHYFSYLFKKTQGCSPKDYRARGRQ